MRLIKYEIERDNSRDDIWRCESEIKDSHQQEVIFRNESWGEGPLQNKLVKIKITYEYYYETDE